MAKSIEESLDECIGRIIAEGYDIDRCVLNYPHMIEELETLLEAAVYMRRTILSVRIRPEFKFDMNACFNRNPH